ncbi:MAG: pitrilysin family protein [Rhodothermales bacterium]|nr:pitrilysin family protein [Rhodothermales bacterium]
MNTPAASGFDKTTLPNGLRIVTEAIPSVRSISVGVWVYTGSRDESEAEAGISHFIEHMVFKGTQRRRMDQIARRLESVGGYLNAFTTKEYTCYYARALDEHLDRAIDVTCDLILRPTFPEKELDKEKDVVIEEIKMYEDVPEDLIFDRYEAVVYKNTPLARPIIGYPDSVRSFTRDQLQHYVDTRYTPARTIISVAGNIDHNRVVQYVRKAFEGVDRTNREYATPSVNGYAPGDLIEPRPIQQAHLVLGRRAFGIMDERRSVMNVLNTILGSGMSSRLNQNIREKYGFCYSIYSFANMQSDTGDFGVYMGTDSKKIPRATKLILREIDRLAQVPISPRLLHQAVSQVKGSLMLGLESMSNRMMRLGKQELYFGRNFSLDEIIASVEAVTAAQVQDLAQTLFAPDTFSTIALTPA